MLLLPKLHAHRVDCTGGHHEGGLPEDSGILSGAHRDQRQTQRDRHQRCFAQRKRSYLQRRIATSVLT